MSAAVVLVFFMFIILLGVGIPMGLYFGNVMCKDDGSGWGNKCQVKTTSAPTTIPTTTPVTNPPTTTPVTNPPTTTPVTTPPVVLPTGPVTLHAEFEVGSRYLSASGNVLAKTKYNPESNIEKFLLQKQSDGTYRIRVFEAPNYITSDTVATNVKARSTNIHTWKFIKGADGKFKIQAQKTVKGGVGNIYLGNTPSSSIDNTVARVDQGTKGHSFIITPVIINNKEPFFYANKLMEIKLGNKFISGKSGVWRLYTLNESDLGDERLRRFTLEPIGLGANRFLLKVVFDNQYIGTDVQKVVRRYKVSKQNAEKDISKQWMLQKSNCTGNNWKLRNLKTEKWLTMAGGVNIHANAGGNCLEFIFV
jgi:hypothetical protein